MGGGRGGGDSMVVPVSKAYSSQSSLGHWMDYSTVDPLMVFLSQ